MPIHRDIADATFARLDALEKENQDLRRRLASSSANAEASTSVSEAFDALPPEMERREQTFEALDALERRMEADGTAEPTAISANGVDAAAGARRSTLHEFNLSFPRLERLDGMRGAGVDCPACATRSESVEMLSSVAELDAKDRLLVVVICTRCGYTGCVRRR